VGVVGAEGAGAGEDARRHGADADAGIWSIKLFHGAARVGPSSPMWTFGGVRFVGTVAEADAEAERLLQEYDAGLERDRRRTRRVEMPEGE
jgi:hypothetical protein